MRQAGIWIKQERRQGAASGMWRKLHGSFFRTAVSRQAAMQPVATQSNVPVGPATNTCGVQRQPLFFSLTFSPYKLCLRWISGGLIWLISPLSFLLTCFLLSSIHQLSPEGPSSFLTSSKAFEILNMSLHLILEDPLRSAIVPLGFPGGSEGRESACSAGDLGLIPRSGRSPGEDNDCPIQYFCLENSMDRGAWLATVQEVAELDKTEWLTLSHNFQIV